MKIINFIKNVLLDIIILVLLITIIFSIMNKNKPKPIFGYYFFTVLTGSMEPELKVDDSIIVKRSNDYKVGDVVTYEYNNSYVTHRIIEINKKEIITKGDANTTADVSIEKKNILGKVVYKSKYLNFFVKNRVLIILLVILIYLIGMVFKDDKGVKGNAKEI